MSSIKPGQEFGRLNQYRIQRKLAEGGNGTVLIATEFSQEGEYFREVAIKTMNQPDSVYGKERFKREAAMVAKLRSPTTVTLYEYGTDSETGLYYMAYEYVEGTPLDEVLKADGAMSPYRTAKIMEALLHSLEEAHNLGIVHRDIKPANIMLYEMGSQKDNVKLLDFGIGKNLGDNGDFQLTMEALGTPAYMSPEQHNPTQMEITPATDLFAVGLVAYECLVGKRAAQGRSVGELAMFVTHQHAKVPEVVYGMKVDRGFRQIIDSMTAPKPEDRTQSATEVLTQMEGLLLDRRTPTGELEASATQVAQLALAGSAEQVHVAQTVVPGSAVLAGPVEKPQGAESQRSLNIARVLAVVLALGLGIGVFAIPTEEDVEGQPDVPVKESVDLVVPPKTAAVVEVELEPEAAPLLDKPLIEDAVELEPKLDVKETAQVKEPGVKKKRKKKQPTKEVVPVPAKEAKEGAPGETPEKKRRNKWFSVEG